MGVREEAKRKNAGKMVDGGCESESAERMLMTLN